MLREREHVHWLNALYCVALFRKDIKIALQALRAAGYVDDTIRGSLNSGI